MQEPGTTPPASQSSSWHSFFVLFHAPAAVDASLIVEPFAKVSARCGELSMGFQFIKCQLKASTDLERARLRLRMMQAAMIEKGKRREEKGDEYCFWLWYIMLCT
jgi:hypothetical protein